jgi:hypothetical protein
MKYNPKYKPILGEFKKLGVPNEAITWLDYKLQGIEYDILRYGKGDGTFPGLVRRIAALLPLLERNVKNTERYGLATIEGAGDDEDEYVAAATTVAVAIIVGLIFGFCMKWT